jgi:hypothetical protein
MHRTHDPQTFAVGPIPFRRTCAPGHCRWCVCLVAVKCLARFPAKTWKFVEIVSVVARITPPRGGRFEVHAQHAWHYRISRSLVACSTFSKRRTGAAAAEIVMSPFLSLLTRLHVILCPDLYSPRPIPVPRARLHNNPCSPYSVLVAGYGEVVHPPWLILAAGVWRAAG